MEPLTKVTGVVAPFPKINIDTDQIVPSAELVRVHSDGYAPSLFAGQRYTHDREPDPDFLLNRAPFDGATILAAGANFGCGSSREDAPKALRAFGFRVVIAESFGGIFFNNCFMNGVLPVELPFERIVTDSNVAEGETVMELTVDLEAQTVILPTGEALSFECPAVQRRMLLEGLDDIELTFRDRDAIEAHWRKDADIRPWIDLSATRP